MPAGRADVISTTHVAPEIVILCATPVGESDDKVGIARNITRALSSRRTAPGDLVPVRESAPLEEMSVGGGVGRGNGDLRGAEIAVHPALAVGSGNGAIADRTVVVDDVDCVPTNKPFVCCTSRGKLAGIAGPDYADSTWATRSNRTKST